MALPNLLHAQQYDSELKITGEVIDYFTMGQTSVVYNLFDDTMKSSLTSEKLVEIWTTLTAQCGKFIGSGKSAVVESQGYVVVNKLIDFEKTDLDIRIAFNKQKQISGLFFVPPVDKK